MNADEDMIAQITGAQHKHLKWKVRLMTAIAQGQADVTPEEAACDRSCDFGKWFHGPSMGGDVQKTEAWKTINDIHAAFHKSAAQVLRLALTGQADDARTLISGDYGDKTDRMLKALSLWKLELKSKSGGMLDRAGTNLR
ncbi:CZB domain-containing protein [Novosphingobium naphthalenivorans]|uniref:CZB domain-containing protein n=1 Tax=Novosphingobium naphthalenivorans TaxID=273168 RepID=UPI0008379A87|nr:CZB domain-containing protein [Novosphingobium naphthalenivorans]